MNDSPLVTASAWAKINLTLSITGKRKDGFHTLESVMQTVSFADTVSVKKIPSGICLHCSDPALPKNQDNLAYRAAKYYLEETKVKGGCEITLIKSVFSGAGLGGGSADAAAVLRCMETLFCGGANLEKLAAHCGADVPFCLNPQTAFCEGIGEVITPLSFPNKRAVFAVIAQGKNTLSTPEVYRAYDHTANEKRALSPNKSTVIQAIQSGDLQKIASVMHNDLELPAIVLCPDIAVLKDALLQNGAVAAQMTGSGSAVFGLFDIEKSARNCANLLQSQGFKSVFCTLL